MILPTSVQVKKIAVYLVEYIQGNHKFTPNQIANYETEIEIQILRLLIDSRDGSKQGDSK
jgi:hypothetical protein